jgi:hypothetical protein
MLSFALAGGLPWRPAPQPGASRTGTSRVAERPTVRLLDSALVDAMQKSEYP